MIADTLTKHGLTLTDIGLPEDSYFEIVFADGSTVSEKEVGWSAISEPRRVTYFGGSKQVSLCTHPVSSITLHHGDLETTLDVPADHEIYQEIRSSMLFTADKNGRHRVLGRSVGLVKNGEIVEERFLNGLLHEIQGLRL